MNSWGVQIVHAAATTPSGGWMRSIDQVGHRGCLLPDVRHIIP